MKHTVYQPARLVATLVLGIFAGAVFLAPAEAHLGSFEHLTRHFFTRKQALAKFYPKSTANARFVNVGEKASDSDRLDGLDSTALATQTIHGRKGISISFGNTTDFQQLAALNVPTGKWLILSKVTLLNSDTSAPARPTCRLIMGSTLIDQVTFAVDSPGFTNEVVVSLMGGLSGGGTVQLQCEDGASTSIQAYGMDMAATNAAAVVFVTLT